MSKRTINHEKLENYIKNNINAITQSVVAELANDEYQTMLGSQYVDYINCNFKIRGFAVDDLLDIEE